MTEQAGVFDVINTLKSLRGAAKVMESASAAIIAISVEGLSQFSCRVRSDVINIFLSEGRERVVVVVFLDRNTDIIDRENVVSYLLEALKMHQTNPKVVQNTLRALAAIVEPSGVNSCEMQQLVSGDGLCIL